MNTITFDDFVLHDEIEYGSTGWAYICSHCAKKYGINPALLDESGGGDPETDDGPICSVKGCNHVATAYLDIPDSVAGYIKNGEWEIPLIELQK